ncbi:MAG: hypothetical protein AAF682_18370 [Planctomycetota bacterium]
MMLRALVVFGMLHVAGTAQGQLWVVDQQGGADFAKIDPAIAAAAAGDVIVVRSGDYEAFTVDRGVTLVAAEGELVTIGDHEGFTVSGVPAGESAIVRGLSMEDTVVVDGNAGTVWLEDLVAVGDYDPSVGPRPGLRVDGSASVVVVRCDFSGSDSIPVGILQDPGAGAELTGSSMHAFDSVFRGLEGHGAFSGSGGHSAAEGAPGIRASSSFVFLGGCFSDAGDGGYGHVGTLPCFPPADGGVGVELTDSESELYTLDSLLAGGVGGGVIPPSFFCPEIVPGDDGEPVGGLGTFSALPGDALTLMTPHQVAPGHAVPLELAGGPPGAPVFVGLGVGPAPLFLAPLFGTLFVEGPYEVVSLGLLDGGGALSASLPASPVSAGDEAAMMHLQAGYLSPSFEVVLAAPSEVTVADLPVEPKSVWVVASSGSGAFLTFAEALAAIQPSDTLLVRDGTYDGFDVNFPVAIVAEEGHNPEFNGAITIQGIPAGEEVLVRGLRHDDGGALVLSDNEGTIWLEETTVQGFGAGSQPAMLVQDCAHVVLADCSVRGESGSSTALDGYAGLVARDSALSLYDTSVTGGDGQDWSAALSSTVAGDGGPAVIFENVFAVLGGAEVRGGDGGSGKSSELPCIAPGDGGTALVLAMSGSDVQYLDSTILGGEPGVDSTSGGFCTGATGLPGEDIEGLGAGGTLTQLSGEAILTVSTTSPAREGQPIEVDLTGPILVPAFLAFGEAPFDLFQPALSGIILVEPPYLVPKLGVLNGVGKLSTELFLPDLPAGVQSKVFFGQVGYLSGSSAVVLGAPTALLQLDASF